MIGKRGKKKKEDLLNVDSSLKKNDVELINDKIINVNDKNYEKVMFLYSSAMKQIKNKIEIIQEELKLFYNYDPIDHVTTRLKTPESIMKKLNRNNYANTYDTLFEKVNDIAGIRIICNYKEDIYRIVQFLENMQDIKVLNKKDYMKKPKKSGYRSYHMLVQVPVFLTQGIMFVKVEIQLRTLGMDFWSIIEHKLKYKNDDITPEESKKLEKYAKIINSIDDNFMDISTKINERNGIKTIPEDTVVPLNQSNLNYISADPFFDIDKNNREAMQNYGINNVVNAKGQIEVNKNIDINL